MMRLLGNIEAKTDAKGRVFLPATFRKVLQGGEGGPLMLRKDVYQPCLNLYPEKAWNEQMDSVRARINRWNPQHQDIYRQFLSDVEIVYPDANGRILIPRRLLEAAGIKQGIRFIGMGDYIEVWSAENTEKPFVEAKEFTEALTRLMGGEPPSHEE
jgi:MraZ protein